MKKHACLKCGGEDTVLKCTNCGSWICPFCILLRDPEKKTICPLCEMEGFKIYEIEVDLGESQ